MPKDPLGYPGGPDEGWYPFARVSGMQAKLHRWATADRGRRFDDLFNLVHDPATLIVAFDRVAGNRGARSAGVDGLTVGDVEQQMGAPGFLDDLRSQLKAGTFRPLPVRERTIAKLAGSGKVRRLGIPTVTDRVVQAALKLVLEPISRPVSFRCRMGSGPGGGRRTRLLRSTCSVAGATGGCWTPTSRRVSTRSNTLR